jgi:hypothetical protein
VAKADAVTEELLSQPALTDGDPIASNGVVDVSSAVQEVSVPNTAGKTKKDDKKGNGGADDDEAGAGSALFADVFEDADNHIAAIRKDAAVAGRNAIRRAVRAKETAAFGSKSLMTQLERVLNREVDAAYAAQAGAILTNAQQFAFNRQLSGFAISGISKLSHSGFTVTSNGVNSDGLGFQSENYGMTFGMRWDASNALNLQNNVFVVGVIGNYTQSNIKINASDAIKAHGAGSFGEGDIDTVTAGAYSVINFAPFYVLGVASYSWGDPSFQSNVYERTSKFSTNGVLSSLSLGSLIHLHDALRLDLRGGVIYSHNTAGDYEDNHGLTYTDSKSSEAGVQLSGKFFSTHDFDDYRLRPFVQTGFTQRFAYSNEIKIGDNRYLFEDDDKTVFGRIGLDIEYSDTLQSYIALGGDFNSDSTSLSGQIGVTWKID